MKKVAIITNIPAPYRVDLFWYLQHHTEEYEIHIFYASRNEDNREWKIEESRFKNSHFLDSYTIKIPYGFDTKYIHISKGIKKELKKLHPAIVVGAEYNPTILQALQYCRKQKIPYISWTDGTLYSERNINVVQRMLRKYIIHNAKACLASSTKAKEAQLFYGAAPDSCFISFLTVDLEKYKVVEAKRDNGRIFCVGSLIKRKGIDLLFKALQGIEKEYTLALAGSGPEVENLKNLVKDLGIEKRVEFLGYLSEREIKEEYAKSSIFVLPTREDCFGLVILEAMCAGLPVISSKFADGAYDLIEEGKNGYIIDPYQTDKFQEYIQILLDAPEKCKKMGQMSYERLKLFRFEQVSKGIWEAFAYVAYSGE